MTRAELINYLNHAEDDASFIVARIDTQSVDACGLPQGTTLTNGMKHDIRDRVTRSIQRDMDSEQGIGSLFQTVVLRKMKAVGMALLSEIQADAELAADLEQRAKNL